MSLDWQWNAWDAGAVPEGKLVVLKMADRNDDVSYAVARCEDGELLFIARENENAALPVHWMALPD